MGGLSTVCSLLLSRRQLYSQLFASFVCSWTNIVKQNIEEKNIYFN